MVVWEVNKGIGRSIEFQGLKAQYIFIFAGGLLGMFLFVLFLVLLGVPQVLSLIVGLLGATLLVWQTFAMNKKYGEYGFMKLQARAFHPYYLRTRYRSERLIRAYKFFSKQQK